MFSRHSFILAIGFLGVVCLLTVGCKAKTVGRSILGTTIGDREVKVSVDGAGFISSQGEAAVVSFGRGKLVVEKGSVQLNGKELAKLPEEAKKIEIDYTAGTLKVTADGAGVLTTELRK